MANKERLGPGPRDCMALVALGHEEKEEQEEAEEEEEERSGPVSSAVAFL